MEIRTEIMSAGEHAAEEIRTEIMSTGEHAAEPQIGVRTLSTKCDPIEIEALTTYGRSS
jgi:hypothetical protein